MTENDFISPQYSKEAEQAVLGAVLVNPEVYHDVAQFLSTEDFFLHHNRWIWEAFDALEQRGEPIDVLTVSEELERRGQLEDCRGTAYLAGLIENVPTSLHAEAYAHVIKEKASQRRILDGAEELAKLTTRNLDETTLVTEFKEIVEPLLTSISPIGHRPVSWKEQLEAIPKISWLWEGWLPIGLISIIVGPPEVGKSALALMIALSITTGAVFPDGVIPEKTGLVVWYETENAEAINHGRAQEWGIPVDQILVPSKYQDPLSEVDLIDPEGWMLFETSVRTEGVLLVIIDSLGGAYTRENNPKIKKLMKRLGKLARDAQVAMLIVHHPRKLQFGEETTITLDRVRGHSAISQFARTIWAIEKPDPIAENIARCKMIKSNLGKKPRPFGFEILNDGVIWIDAPQDPIVETQYDRAINLLKNLLSSGPIPATEINDKAEEAGISIDTIRRAKKALNIKSIREGDRWLWSFPSNM